MLRKKFPLEPLARLKKDGVEKKTRELGQAVSAREALEKTRQGKEGEREAARAAADTVRHEERVELEKGNLRALDLSRAGSWESRVRADDARRTSDIAEARALEESGREIETQAKTHVAVARAEHESVLRHEERWKALGKRKEEAAEEEVLADVVRPKPRS